VAFTLLALAVKSAVMFFAGTALSGAGFGSSFQGGIRTVVPESPRISGPGAVLLFAVSYLGLGVPRSGRRHPHGPRPACPDPRRRVLRAALIVPAVLALLALLRVGRKERKRS
jgi:hypothetical protein